MRTGSIRGLPAVVLVVLAGVACGVGPLAVPQPPEGRPAALPAGPDGPTSPTGSVVVAHPEPPSTLLARPGAHDTAASDLEALWGLPLLRLDDTGQARPALAEDWDVQRDQDGTTRVDLQLAPGRWTDGTAVDAQDVVATLDWRREQDPARFGAFTGVEALAGDRVRLHVEGAGVDWMDLLVEAGTTLPAEAVAAGPVHAPDELPPTAGPFRLADVEAGLSATFAAHADGPLGPPTLASVEVLFTPSFETALGLLEDGDVDVVLGHVAVNPVARAREVEGVDAAAPAGGTLVSLEFASEGLLGQPDDAGRRRAIGEAVAVGELVEGLLGPFGVVAESPWTGHERPPGVPAGELNAEVEVALAYPRDHEVLGFAARIVQRDLLGRGVGTELIGRPAGEDTPESADVSLTLRRLPPHPALGPFLQRDGAEGDGTALRDVATTARIVPLFRVGVAHAWRDVEGVRPSSWPGLGLWNAHAWRLP